jgi:hypothetical protein
VPFIAGYAQRPGVATPGAIDGMDDPGWLDPDRDVVGTVPVLAFRDDVDAS